MKIPFRRSSRPALKGPEDRMTLRDHLAELRVRIVRSLLAVVLGVIIIMAFYDHVLKFITQPYYDLCHRKPAGFCDSKLYSLGPLDGFSQRVSISLYGGLIIAFPVILWQVWRFVVPGLHAKEKKYAIPFIASIIALFAFGGFVAYWTLGYALEFLISWSGSGVGQVFQISKYVSLVGLMVAAYGIGFEFPVFLVFLQLVGVVTPQTLLKQWRYAIMIIFVLAGVITPSGDPISMLALAIPMTVFYLVSIGIGLILQRRKRKRGDTGDSDDDEDAGPAMAGATTA
ncbi:MAG: tatC [Ilumatobacteraceae bacterium]|nr:tatC [Ilumatobacteraceae bacterium]